MGTDPILLLTQLWLLVCWAVEGTGFGRGMYFHQIKVKFLVVFFVWPFFGKVVFFGILVVFFWPHVGERDNVDVTLA